MEGDRIRAEVKLGPNPGGVLAVSQQTDDLPPRRVKRSSPTPDGSLPAHPLRPIMIQRSATTTDLWDLIDIAPMLNLSQVGR